MLNKKNTLNFLLIFSVLITIICLLKKFKKITYTFKQVSIETVVNRKISFYEKYVKRFLDVIFSILILLCFGWIYIVVAILVKLKLGSPVIFTQDRPGIIDRYTNKETIFKMYKFRTMTNEKDEFGNLLPDEKRLNKFGSWLRSTSLDELPEIFNVLNGTMTLIGPRPQLIKDMVFMTTEQRIRHTAKPGISGLAQINGRNAISWEEKIDLDLKYISKISFVRDAMILLKTIKEAFFKRNGITYDNMATAEDLGDYLLRTDKVNEEFYHNKQKVAKDIVDKNHDEEKSYMEFEDEEVFLKYSVLMSLYRKEKPENLRLALNSMLNQTIKPDEIVLVEDGPLNKELYEVVDEYKKYLKIVKNEKNIGLGLSLNKGIAFCRNELIARMDTDDFSKSERCEKQINKFKEKPYLSIVGSHIDEFIDDISNVVSQRKVPIDSEDIYNYAKKRSPFNHPTVMYRKSKVLEQGGYSDLKRNQDVDLFGRMLFSGCKAENIDESLLYFRVSDELAKRRKSWENSWSYISTIKKFWEMGYSSFGDYLIVLFSQIIIYILPISIQKYIYKKFLRK